MASLLFLPFSKWSRYTVFAGLSDIVNMVKNMKFTEEQILYFQYAHICLISKTWIGARCLIATLSSLTIWDPSIALRSRCISVLWDSISIRSSTSVPEGTFVYPHEPVLIIEGPLAICQVLETPILNLCNFARYIQFSIPLFASLITTNATRLCYAAGNTTIVEFGLRRAQVFSFWECEFELGSWWRYVCLKIQLHGRLCWNQQHSCRYFL